MITLMTFVYICFTKCSFDHKNQIIEIQKISYASIFFGLILYILFINLDVAGGRLFDIFMIGLVFLIGNLNANKFNIIASKILIFCYFIRSCLIAPLISF